MVYNIVTRGLEVLFCLTNSYKPKDTHFTPIPDKDKLRYVHIFMCAIEMSTREVTQVNIMHNHISKSQLQAVPTFAAHHCPVLFHTSFLFDATATVQRKHNIK